MNGNSAQADFRTAPIRTYREVVDAMRAKGDTTITINHIHYYEQSAFRKLRMLLDDLREWFE
jgi:nicotinamidase-related amidase